MRYTFKNGIEAEIDFKNKRISGVYRGGENLICGNVPFFSVKMRKKDGSHRIITAFECEYLGENGNSRIYENADFTVKLSVIPTEKGLRWRIAVDNRTDDLLEWVELGSFGVCEKLAEEYGGKGAILFPYNEGCLVTDMRKRNNSPFPYIEPEYPSLGKYSVFPNMLSSQFIAYLTDGVGIYLGMHDEERTTKHIDFKSEENCIRVQSRCFCNVNYGESYEMPFDTETIFFVGEWQEACEIYRNWFENHLPNGLKKIADNGKLPKWYEESPITAIYPVRGTRDTGDMTPNELFFPYENAIPFLRDFAEKTASRVMALLMHWEGTAPWAPPYMTEPFGGSDMFKKFVDKAHTGGLLVGLYCSGFGYTLQSNVIKTYNKEAEFERENLGEIMCSDSDGTLKSEICSAQRSGLDMCPACEKTKEIFSGEINKIIGEFGIDYMQALDQNHGGSSYFCYSDKHGHIPAPGKWQQEETNKTLGRIKNTKTVLGCESAASEPFISKLAFSDNRFELNYYIGTPVPVYSYIYHEYVNNFMGNQICVMLEKTEINYTMRAAYSFIAGDCLSVVFSGDGSILHSWCDWISPKDKRVDKDVAIKFLKTLNGWRTGGGKNFLRLGRAVKPQKIGCGKVSLLTEYGTPFFIDECLTAAYEYGGKIAQFIVNFNLSDKKVKIDGSGEVFYDSDLSCRQNFDGELIIPALSVVMLKKTGRGNI